MCYAAPENDLDHTPTIRQHYVFLVDNLDSKHSGLVGELYQAGVLSTEERDIISSELISFTQNDKLLSMLSRKIKEQFDKFLNALDNTGQQHVRNVITGRQGQLVVHKIQEIVSNKILSKADRPGVLFTKGRTTDSGRTPVVHQNLRRAGYSRNLSYVRSSYSCCQSSVNSTTGVRLSYALRRPKYVYYCKSRWLFIVYQTFMLD